LITDGIKHMGNLAKGTSIFSHQKSTCFEYKFMGLVCIYLHKYPTTQ